VFTFVRNRCSLSPEYAQGASDEEWIALVAKQGWIAITKDKNTKYRKYERQAIRDSGATVLVLRAKNMTGVEMGKVLADNHAKIQRYFKNHPGPRHVGMDRHGNFTDYPLDG